MRPRIKPYLRLRLLDDNVLLFGEDKNAKNIPLNPMLAEFIALLDGNREIAEIHASLKREYPLLNYQDVESGVRQLREANLVEDGEQPSPSDFREEELDRYDRQLLFFSMFEEADNDRYALQRRLKGARITVLGCGGIGSHTILNLACAGVGYVRIVDFDVVEPSNLNRSFVYGQKDVGKPKSAVLRDKMCDINPHIEYDFVEQKIGAKDDLTPLLDDTDFAVLCADTPYLRINEWFNEVCLRLRVPYGLAGSSEVYGTVGPITVPYETSCFECHGYDRTDLFAGPDFLVKANRRRVAPSFVPIIASLASMNSLEIVKYITRFSEPSIFNKQLKVDFSTLEFQYVDRPRRADCVACGAASVQEGANVVA